MEDRFKFRIPMLTDKGSFMEFQYIELGEEEECTLCGYNGEPQQCTGLKDTDGKLIFDGDIVKFKTELFGKPKQIIWDECHYRLKNTFITLCNMEIKQFGLEVIGNIYENPELLESEV